jgi:sRNA-binding carbon storage regulator CsrA
MVVLSRKSRESVVVGAANPFERLLKVTVLEIGDGLVTLGFEVDPDVAVECPDMWAVQRRIDPVASAFPRSQ